jgi:hypothetical protein
MNWAAMIAAARKILTPAQICWICLVSTGGLYTYSVKIFASNSEVKVLHIRFSEASLFDLRTKQCEAIRRNQSGAAYRQKIQELMREYRDQTGGDYALPPCAEL